MFDCMRAHKNGGGAGLVYMLSFFLLSNYIILNLFIGAILANMGTQDDDDRIAQTEKMKEEKIAAQLRARSAQIFANSRYQEWVKAGGKGDLCSMYDVLELDFAVQTFEDGETPNMRFGISVDNKALMFFEPSHPARRWCYNLVKNPYFDMFILLVIMFGTVLLALDNQYTREQQAWIDLFTTADTIFLIIFTIEFFLKAFAFGLIWSDNIEFMLADQENLKALVLGDTGEPAYFYNGWNYLDMIVLIVSFILKTGDPDGPLKILRLLRAFRPLRMVNRIAGMKLVLGALVAACPALANVCILLMAVFLIFAILGLSLFMGRFFACNKEDATGKGDCTGSFDAGEGFIVPAVWANPALDGFGSTSFDNIGASFLILFEVATGDSWETVLFQMTDIPAEVGGQPGENISRGYGFFCIVFVFVGQLFMLQLFVSVIIDSFNFAEGSGLLTGEQALYADMLKLTKMLNPEPKPTPMGNDDEEEIEYTQTREAKKQMKAAEDLTANSNA